jgi:hypothetical protein
MQQTWRARGNDLFDNFVGTRKQGRRLFDAKRRSGLEVHHEPETGRSTTQIGLPNLGLARGSNTYACCTNFCGLQDVSPAFSESPP